MSTALKEAPTTEILPANQAPPSLGRLAVRDAITELKAIREFVADEMIDGLDFGTIPGTGSKPTLLQPGAQKIAMYFNCRPKFRVKARELENGHVEYVVVTDLISRTNERVVGSGLGSCSTMESKYRFRNAARTCPRCGKEFIIKGKAEYGGGWLCFAKKGGCGAKFKDHDRSITDQVVGTIENENPHDQRNTALKMAKKRSQVDAALNLGCMSELFTQDLEEHHARPASYEDEEPRAEYHGSPEPGNEVPPETAPPKKTQPQQTPAKARPQRTWDQFLDAALAYWAKHAPAPDDKAAGARLFKLINAMGTRAIEDGEIAEARVLKPAQAGKEPARDQSKLIYELRELYEEDPKYIGEIATDYLEEKIDLYQEEQRLLADQPADAPAQEEAQDLHEIPTLDDMRSKDASEGWEPDGKTLSDWCDLIETKYQVQMRAHIKGIAQEKDWPARWSKWDVGMVDTAYDMAAAKLRKAIEAASSGEDRDPAYEEALAN